MRLSAAPWRELPPVTRWLVGACFAGWLARLLLPDITLHLGLVPLLVTQGFRLWQPFTYIFLHADFWHFLFNSFMLWMLGRVLEPRFGSRKFLLYFLACGAAAALLTVAWTPLSPRPVIGASGSVYGLLAAFAWLYPEAQVYFFFLFPMSARMMAVLLGGLEFVMTLSQPGSRISSVTHLGGLAAGLAWLWAERRLRERPAEERPDPAAREQAEIDRLLEKISRGGQDALSSGELRRLDDYARRKGGRA